MWQPPSDIVLISDPRVAAIPVRENHDPLADVRGRLRVDERLADPAGAYAHLRSGLLARLERAARLLPDGYELLIVEGYRPIGTQRRYFEEYRDQLQATFPDMSPDEAHVAASRYVSPVEVAPHTAGAAVDLTLCAPDGTEYDMGTQVNDNPEDSDGACYTAAPRHLRRRPRAPQDPRRRPGAGRPGQLPHRVVALVLRRPLLGPRLGRARRLLRTSTDLAVPEGGQGAQKVRRLLDSLARCGHGSVDRGRRGVPHRRSTHPPRRPPGRRGAGRRDGRAGRGARDHPFPGGGQDSAVR